MTRAGDTVMWRANFPELLELAVMLSRVGRDAVRVTLVAATCRPVPKQRRGNLEKVLIR